MKYFIVRETGAVLSVDEERTLGEGKLVDAYMDNDAYTPCDKDGKPLKAVAPKAEAPKAEEKPAEAPKAEAKK